MTAVKDVVDVYINLNMVLIFALLVWLVLRVMFARLPARAPHSLQLGALKTLLGLVALSPVLAWAMTSLHEKLAPGQSLVLSDLVVAAYLRGDIAMDALRFEQILNTRRSWLEGLLTMDGPVFALVFGAFATGVLVCVFRFARAVMSLRHLLAESCIIKRLGPVDIRCSEHVSVPLAVRGLTRRHVIFPAGDAVSGRRMRIALAHELQHFRNGDLEWEIALEALRPLFFWNPAFTFLKRAFDRQREMSCDEAVMARRGLDAYDYAMCLLHFCDRAVGARRRPVLDVALVSVPRRKARDELAGRLLALKAMRGPLRPGPVPSMLAVIAIGATLSLFAASIQTHKDWSHDRLMLSTVVNLERLAAINSRGF